MADTDRFIFSDGETNYHEPILDVGGGLYSPLPLDPVSWGVIKIDFEHHELHEGDHYYIAGSTTLDSASTDLVDFAIVTPNTTKWAHMTFALSSVGQYTFSIYEGVSFDSDGTPVTAFNNNRNSANTSGLEITTDPSNFTPASSDIIYGPQTFGQDGTIIEVTGGNTARTREIILKQNTKYIFRIDSGTAANVINYVAEWYEHTSKT